jgi:hypothetical protein
MEGTMKTLWRIRLGCLAASFALAASGVDAADRGAASATVGGHKVSIEYGRPALKGRPFAELLSQLPEDRVWRAGENQVTTLTTASDLKVGGRALPAGKYSLYLHLGADGSRSLLINSDLGIPLVKLWAAAPSQLANEPWPRLDGYAKNISAKEVLRAPLRKEKTDTPVDPFTITLAPAGQGATVKLEWGEESWSTDLQPLR